MNKRIYDLAAELGISTKELITFLNSNGIEIKNHLSNINKRIDEFIKENFKDRIMFNSSSLKFIEIIGLFDEYNYKIDFDKSINIFVAENGFGKTTILNIIVSLLKNDREKLKSLPFKAVKIGIGSKAIDIEKVDLMNNIEYMEIISRLRKYIPVKEHRALLREYKMNNFFDVEETLIRLRDYIPNSVLYNILESGYANIENKNINLLNKKFKQIQDSLKEEVVYFPTYRRIEEKFICSSTLSYIEQMNLQSQFQKSSMHFGMDDVENTIKSITDKIKKNSIDDYYQMSNQILDDLLSDSVNLSDFNISNIDKEKIKIVIGRIGKSNIKNIDKLNEFIEKDILTENEKFTAYFINRLALIYESQRALDEKIKKFIEICNKYLVNKKITYDDVLADVKILSSKSKYELKFNQLSSGEKQIISLFAKLYLVLE
ncbi:translation initiation factor IF-2 N-terminal domain-containing protein, partial [Clostridium perfringens]|uniref:translation initiation factor IF-2 N-terminal domain-containing protein n=2 Tax=Clostridiaceae TaxID=31979 RepID=UPI001CCA1A77